MMIIMTPFTGIVKGRPGQGGIAALLFSRLVNGVMPEQGQDKQAYLNK